LFGDLTEHLNPDEKELTKIEAMYDSMTQKERLRPDIINASRINRISKGSGRKPEEVRELLQKFGMMQQVMGTIGQNPGLLGRIPGFKQLGQLGQMKNMDLGSMFGKDPKALEKAMSAMGGGMGGMPMQLPQIAPGYTPPMGQAAMAKARLMGYAPPAVSKPDDRDAIKERRKKEKENKKKNRKKK
ncbi:MAG: signal recognition particle protein, partial [Myxococcaceae bacterium]